ncbi:gas vesicle protein [Dactylosporangium sp. CA-152071]|uniref:gas vesicle protein n=1 Tax=Dactylosporangium sp. CA-152071 TaxID=3239933 RepID=UPI003D8F21F7
MVASQGMGPAPALGTGHQPTNLADILERVLDRGLVIAGDIQVNLLDIELLTLKLRLVIASVDTARQLGIDWWETDPWLSSSNRRAVERGDARREALGRDDRERDDLGHDDLGQSAQPAVEPGGDRRAGRPAVEPAHQAAEPDRYPADGEARPRSRRRGDER